MTSSQFAQSIKSKYPVYENIPDDQLVQKVLTKYPQYKSQIQTNTPFQDANQQIQSNPLMGAANILTAGGLGMNMNVVGNQMDYMANQPSTKGNLGASFNQAIGDTAHLAGQLPQAALGDVLTTLGLKGTKGVLDTGVKMAKGAPGAIRALPEVPQYLSKKGTANLMEKAAQKGTDLGKTADWNDIENQIRQNVGERLGTSARVTQALEKFLTEESPALQGESTDAQLTGKQFNPNQLLSARRAIATRVSPSFFSKLAQAINPAGQATSGQLDQTIANEARKVVTSKLKELAPDIKTPDKLYSFYSKIKGDVPTWTKRAVGGLIADQLLGNKIKGNAEPVIDALGLLLGGSI